MSGAVIAAVVVVLAVVLVDGDDDAAGPRIGDTRLVSDESGVLEVAVPADWDDVNGEPFERAAGGELPRVEAAPDLDAYRDGDSTGMEFVLAEGLGAPNLDDLVDGVADRSEAKERCGAGKRSPFSERGFEGVLEVYRGCGRAGRTLSIVAAVVPGGGAVAVVAVRAGSAGERDTVIESFILAA